MCQFCHQHGEGKKWYLQAENYAEHLLNDIRRSKYIRHFFKDPQRLRDRIELLDTLNRMPGFVQSIIKPVITGRMRKMHYGQVLPIEDVEKIFGFVNSVVRPLQNIYTICLHINGAPCYHFCRVFLDNAPKSCR